MSAASQLMQAIYAHLQGDSGFMVRLGAGVISDRLRERVSLPAVIFSEIDSRDFSTASENGEEHFLTLTIWGDGKSRKESQALAASVKHLLDDAALALGADQHLVTLRFLQERAGREKGKAEQSVSLRFRAVTEALPEPDGP